VLVTVLVIALVKCRQQTADSRQQTADSRQQTADSRQQTADNRQQTDLTAVPEEQASDAGLCIHVEEHRHLSTQPVCVCV
jgi:hypothetical protein